MLNMNLYMNRTYATAIFILFVVKVLTLILSPLVLTTKQKLTFIALFTLYGIQSEPHLG